MGIYSDIKKLHMDHSKLLFAIFKIYEKGLISQKAKVIMKKRVIKSDDKLFEVLHRFTQTGETDQEYLESGLLKIAIELNRKEHVEEAEKTPDLLTASSAQKNSVEIVRKISKQLHTTSPYGTQLQKQKLKRSKQTKQQTLFDEEDTVSPIKRPKGLRVQHPGRQNYHNNPVNERDLDFDDSDEDDDGPSKIMPEVCFGGKSPAIEDTSTFMKLRETKK